MTNFKLQINTDLSFTYIFPRTVITKLQPYNCRLSLFNILFFVISLFSLPLLCYVNINHIPKYLKQYNVLNKIFCTICTNRRMRMKKCKCFFTYIHLDLFPSHPSKCAVTIRKVNKL